MTSQDDKPPLHPINELNKWDRDKCLEQIQRRRDLINQMVGDLYPRIVQGEIDKIEVRLQEVKSEQKV